MYDQHTQVITSFLEDLQLNAPEAYAYLYDETIGASTGLEYYGMLGSAVEAAFERGLIPANYKEKVFSVEKAVRKIYGS